MLAEIPDLIRRFQMGSYKYAGVFVAVGVGLYSTDSETLDRILAELKRFIFILCSRKV